MRKNDEKGILEKFSKKLIQTARDAVIEGALQKIMGENKGKIGKKIAEKLSTLTPEQKEAVSDLIINNVDGAINNFLWIIDQEENLDIVAYHDNEIYSLKKISGDLSIDYWDFVEEFSRHKILE